VRTPEFAGIVLGASAASFLGAVTFYCKLRRKALSGGAKPLITSIREGSAKTTQEI